MTTRDGIWTDEEIPGSRAGLVLGLWLSGVFAASLGGWLEYGRDTVASMGLLAAAVVWPVFYFALSAARFVPRAMPVGAACALALFVLTAVLSSFLSPVALRSAGYVALTLAGIWVALQFNSNLDQGQYERGLKVFAVLTVGMLLGFAWYDYVPGKRLGTGKDILNPNTIALVSTSVFLAAMVIRTLLLRLAVMGAIAGVIVLTGSRAAAIAAAAGLATVLWIRLRGRGGLAPWLAGIGLLAAAGVAVAYGDAVYSALDRVYALSSGDRGLGSGATGRIVAWKATWDLFVHHPALGVGFRAHEQVLKVATSAHNGYLATLAEVGIIGFLGVMFMVLRALGMLWRASHDPLRGFNDSVLFGLSISYLLLAVFERYLINVGNPTSLLFLLAVVRPKETETPLLEEDAMFPAALEEAGVG